MTIYQYCKIRFFDALAHAHIKILQNYANLRISPNKMNEKDSRCHNSWQRMVISYSKVYR